MTSTIYGMNRQGLAGKTEPGAGLLEELALRVHPLGPDALAARLPHPQVADIEASTAAGAPYKKVHLRSSPGRRTARPTAARRT